MRRNRIIAIVILLIVTLFLVSCVPVEEEKKVFTSTSTEERIKLIYEDDSMGAPDIHIYLDTKTGFEYLAVEDIGIIALQQPVK